MFASTSISDAARAFDAGWQSQWTPDTLRARQFERALPDSASQPQGAPRMWGTGKNPGVMPPRLAATMILKATIRCICPVRRWVAHSARIAISAQRV